MNRFLVIFTGIFLGVGSFFILHGDRIDYSIKLEQIRQFLSRPQNEQPARTVEVAGIGEVYEEQPATSPYTENEPFGHRQPEKSIYRWVDANGTVHYSDKPLSNSAQKTQLKPLMSYQAPTYKSASSARLGTAVTPVAHLIQVEAPSPRERYDVAISASQAYDVVEISGRVSGSSCRSLRVDYSANSDAGGYVSGSVMVKELLSGGSKLVVDKRRAYRGKITPSWKITRASATCLEQY